MKHDDNYEWTNQPPEGYGIGIVKKSGYDLSQITS
jgi:hypothetical protein